MMIPLSLNNLEGGKLRELLKSRIGKYKMVRDQPDWYHHYINDFTIKRRHIDAFGNETTSGTMMPPSPGVHSLSMAYTYTDILRVIVTYDFRDQFKQLLSWIKRNQPDQLYHRSRMVAAGVSDLRRPELDKRLRVASECQQCIQPYSLTESQSSEAYDIAIQGLLRYMRPDREWINKYILEHKLSSTGEGLKWSELQSLHYEDWLDIYNGIRGIIEYISNNEGYLDYPLYTGLRARSPVLTNMNQSQQGEIDRTRIIMFHPSLSLWTLFLPEKKEWYKEVLNRYTTEVVGADINAIHTPIIEGGGVYVWLSERLQEGKELYAYDGSSWDSLAGTILGSRWNTVLVHVPVPMLPSGITMTSIIDTLASISVWSKEFNEDAVILGDDINVVSAKQPAFKGNKAVQYQPMDTNRQFMLGVSYREDPARPRLQGIKLTSDRGDKAIHLEVPLSEPGQTPLIEGKHDIKTQLLWYMMYAGQFGDRTLLDAIMSIRAEDYKGPTEMIHALAEEHQQEYQYSDLKYWLESEGVMKV